MTMDQTRVPSLVAAVRTTLKPEGTLGMARPRKRLQKPCTRQPKQQQLRQQLPIRHVPDSKHEPSENRPAIGSKVPRRAAPSWPLPAQPQPPDLSDSKWADYLGKEEDGSNIGTLEPAATSEDSPNTPSVSFPEFAHLAPANPQPRPSIDSSRTRGSYASSDSARRRRRAKTPVLRIGQLESKSRHSSAVRESRPKRQSAEVMAEEYRALLNSRGPMTPEPTSAQSSPRYPTSHRRPPTPPKEIRVDTNGEANPPPAVDLAGCSPTSEDGTLVAFEEETIYFKPLPFPSEPESPSTSQLFALSSIHSAAPTPRGLSLQICLDLLTRELSSAILSKSNRSGAEVSSLQIWLMIEAYEKLRDQLEDAPGIPKQDLVSVEKMLDMWLRALYAIHDSVTAESRNAVSRADIDALHSEDLD